MATHVWGKSKKGVENATGLKAIAGIEQYLQYQCRNLIINNLISIHSKRLYINNNVAVI